MIADSTSRWAEALREFASRIGGCPPRRATRPAWPRRWPRSTSGPAGRHHARGREGSVTIIGAVSPPGGDMTEPVTAYTQRFVRVPVDARPRPRLRPALPGRLLVGLLLPRRRRRSRPGTPAAATRTGRPRRARLAALLAEADRLGELAELIGARALPAAGAGRRCWAAGCCGRAVLQQSALSGHRRLLRRGEDGGAGRRRARRRRGRCEEAGPRRASRPTCWRPRTSRRSPGSGTRPGPTTSTASAAAASSCSARVRELRP